MSKIFDEVDADPDEFADKLEELHDNLADGKKTMTDAAREIVKLDDPHHVAAVAYLMNAASREAAWDLEMIADSVRQQYGDA
ncbi:MAG: hypothetical protein SVU32_04680 [Candidatus Nanohaloarchaea archaeon]|nr:hypothetical protein [Candidatus Nanohaloarchaea archaeon]